MIPEWLYLRGDSSPTQNFISNQILPSTNTAAFRFRKGTSDKGTDPGGIYQTTIHFSSKRKDFYYDKRYQNPHHQGIPQGSESEGSAKEALDNENGDFYISEGVKVIIAVILGSLLITAMVALFNSQIIPGIQDKITHLWSYAP